MDSGRQDQKLVLFDLDNTLADLGPWYRIGIFEALRGSWDIKAIPVKATPRLSGNTMPNVIRIICEDNGSSPETIEAVLPETLEIYADTVIGARPAMDVPWVMPFAPTAAVLGAMSSIATFLLIMADVWTPHLSAIPRCTKPVYVRRGLRGIR